MANEQYEVDRITIQNSERWDEIEYWKLYIEEKKQIQDKYPNKPWYRDDIGKGNHREPFDKEWWDEWCRYKKEIADLLLKPNGNFDKFMYEIRPERERIPIDTWMRGKYNTDGYKNRKNGS